MDIDGWCSDTDREETKCSEKVKAVPLPHRPPQIPHGLAPEIQPGPSEVLGYSTGSQSVLRGCKESRDQFPGYPWIHFCDGCFEFTPYFTKRITFIKNNCGSFVAVYDFISCDR